jgi:8-oxo-dGTP pyrophosphatase MutT (NUDIX family)
VSKTLSAGVVIMRGMDTQRRYLLLRSYRNWDFPKGVVEPGEDPLQAAIREVEEETAITNLVFMWGHEFRETAPYGRGKVARYYLAETRQSEVRLPVNPELGRPEHDEYRWVDYPAAHKLLPARLQIILDWAAQHGGGNSGAARDAD